jgi:hypothetical protein
MAAHQRAFKGEVTGEANRVLAAKTFDELERNGTLAPAIAEAVAPAPAPIERTTQQVGEYTITKEADSADSAVPLSEADARTAAAVWARLRLLLSLPDEGVLGAPSWRTRAKAAIGSMLMPGRVLRVQHEIQELLDDSNRLFGDWRAEPDRKIIVIGG